MKFLSAVHTDVGISKQVNQDAFCLKIAKTHNHKIAFAVLCDGMGGLKNGELASALVVNAFSNWFEDKFSIMIQGKLNFEEIKKQWSKIATEQASRIMEYGKANGISLGTTLTAILIVDNNYLNIHVGDTRIYKLNNSIEQITNDQTVTALEVEQKKLTPEQAKTDSRQHILLQCIGASSSINPEINTGVIRSNEEVLLCTDGFRHMVSDEEIFGVLAPNLMDSEETMKKSILDLINLNKSRHERDNITALLIKVVN